MTEPAAKAILDGLERARLALRSIDEDELEDAVLDAMDYITGHTVKQAIAARTGKTRRTIGVLMKHLRNELQETKKPHTKDEAA